jgi:hypothetical protein
MLALATPVPPIIRPASNTEGQKYLVIHSSSHFWSSSSHAYLKVW